MYKLDVLDGHVSLNPSYVDRFGNCLKFTPVKRMRALFNVKFIRGGGASPLTKRVEVVFDGVVKITVLCDLVKHNHVIDYTVNGREWEFNVKIIKVVEESVGIYMLDDVFVVALDRETSVDIASKTLANKLFSKSRHVMTKRDEQILIDLMCDYDNITVYGKFYKSVDCLKNFFRYRDCYWKTVVKVKRNPIVIEDDVLEKDEIDMSGIGDLIEV